MPDNDYRADLDAFIAYLNGAWRAAGRPTYATLESMSKRVLRQHPAQGVRSMVLAPSTTSEILNRRRKQAPKWPWVLAFLTVLQAAARERGFDVAAVGAIAEWRRRHEAVLAAKEAPPAAPELAADAASDANALMGAFFALVLQAGAPQGRHGSRDIAPEWHEFYLALESAAQVIRVYEPRFVPGLLQTEAYARAVLAQRLPGATAGELDRLTERHMQRQSPRRPQKRRLWAVVEEAALRGQEIAPSVMRAQVEHLIELADEPHIALQVVPDLTGRHLALSEPMTNFRFPEPFLGDVVCLEQPDGALFLHERKDTDHYTKLFNGLTVKAVPPNGTRRMLVKIRDGI